MTEPTALVAGELLADDVIVRLVSRRQAQVLKVLRSGPVVHVTFVDGSGMTYGVDETLHVLRGG